MKVQAFYILALTLFVGACNSKQPLLDFAVSKDSILEGAWAITSVKSTAAPTSSQNAALAALAMTNGLPIQAYITPTTITLSDVQGEIEVVQYKVEPEKASGRISIVEGKVEKSGQYQIVGDKLSIVVDGVTYEMHKQTDS